MKKDLFTDKGDYAGLYQIDFKITEGDKVLDVGGGNKPYPLSTHIVDFSDEKSKMQRHGESLKIDNRTLLDGNVIDVLKDFPDNYFDFCYSSHCFEHIVDLPAALEIISKKCRRGFYALPASDFEFLTTASHYGHVNLCRLIDGVLHIAVRPQNTVINTFSEYFNVLWKKKEFKKMWEGHGGVRGYRFIWEARHCWEDKIEYKFYDDPYKLYPQLEYF